MDPMSEFSILSQHENDSKRHGVSAARIENCDQYIWLFFVHLLLISLSYIKTR
ncbi:uncharacterized protein BT62DRAFT_938603 [Guyanagaster necrorhizus]|uniref:Uncharacterized protein n=1 Tax=Guyanagaster necrorhizus TaxID=856835 RepID=A0A9P7VFV2_9AGAR|nr:uncharacterized protein BT62DRAFT_938595 [Guyanagaster necrorhizus MCA 3950]XP_043033312.1 uncharacterized protein BT62DRAFT_938603 [Guyanagaster necrorhizus MCA 3950]KAG7439804.1 hypothetical protein BT62DRAFT_938595 [Guyanagaster necrorhizus MCA 3950]KAG7439812.1 hypothetical protein BT62DRAFT_938603 [Guyanagaster necrorhizus MCA 3950]